MQAGAAAPSVCNLKTPPLPSQSPENCSWNLCLLNRDRICGLFHRLSGTCDPVHRPTHQQVWDDRQEEHNHKRLERVYPAQDDDLVCTIEYYCQYQKLPNGLPGVAQQRPAVRGVHE